MKAITEKGIGDAIFIFAVETRTHWLWMEIFFFPLMLHFEKRRTVMKKGMYKMLAAALMLTISGGGSR